MRKTIIASLLFATTTPLSVAGFVDSDGASYESPQGVQQLTTSNTESERDIVSDSGSAASKVPQIDRTPAQGLQHNGWDSVKNFVQPVIGVAGNHDDVVGSRDSGVIAGADVQKPVDPNKPTWQDSKINCDNPMYQQLCKELTGASEGGGSQPAQWHTVYSGGGTRNIVVPKSYSSFKLWYRYTGQYNSTSGAISTTKTGTVSGAQGANVSIVYSDKARAYCRGGEVLFNTTAKLSFIATTGVSAPSGVTGAKVYTASCSPSYVQGKIINFVITRFDAYY